jgi:sec-independent protein translocase protein TatB
MFGIGIGEVLVILLAIFLLFGPEALPQIAKQVGTFLAQFKKAVEDMKKEVDSNQK